MTLPMDPRDTNNIPAPGGRAGVRISRRKLLQLGAAGATVAVLSVPSRSVFASSSSSCAHGCTATPSAFGSINLSRPDAYVCGQGKSPGYWKQENHFSDWPSGYRPVAKDGLAATKFKDCFSSAPGILATATLLQVLSPEMAVCNDAVARSLACALLNAADGKTSGILTVDQVKTIWNEYRSRGYYEPTAGVKWYGNSPMTANMTKGGGIIGYLETTWT